MYEYGYGGRAGFFIVHSEAVNVTVLVHGAEGQGGAGESEYDYEYGGRLGLDCSVKICDAFASHLLGRALSPKAPRRPRRCRPTFGLWAKLALG